MARTTQERLTARITRAAQWTALGLAAKGAVCAALPHVGAGFATGPCCAGAVGFAVLTALAVAAAVLVRRAPRWAFALAAASGLDVALTAAVIGLPEIHPVVTASLLALVYGGGALIAVAAWSAASLLRTAPLASASRASRRRRGARLPCARRAA